MNCFGFDHWCQDPCEGITHTPTPTTTPFGPPWNYLAPIGFDPALVSGAWCTRFDLWKFVHVSTHTPTSGIRRLAYIQKVRNSDLHWREWTLLTLHPSLWSKTAPRVRWLTSCSTTWAWPRCFCVSMSGTLLPPLWALNCWVSRLQEISAAFCWIPSKVDVETREKARYLGKPAVGGKGRFL